MVSAPAAFIALVVLVAIQRLVEVRHSGRNESALRRRGAVEHAATQMNVMRVVHGAWLIACVAEVLLFERVAPAALAVIAGAIFLVGQALRLAAIHALGPRWSVKVLVLPEAPPVAGGIFRVVRHPNYLGVVLEMAALPLLGGAWITALVFSVANGLLLFFRIRAEERALESVGGYRAALGDRPRFVPGMGAR